MWKQQMYQVDNPKNNYKNVAYAFFLALAITIAEPSTVLPLIVHHFSDSMVIVGLFASLLRGGAILIQRYAAFHAQAYKRVLPHIRKVFFFRWISRFSIGLSIFLIGGKKYAFLGEEIDPPVIPWATLKLAWIKSGTNRRSEYLC